MKRLTLTLAVTLLVAACTGSSSSGSPTPTGARPVASSEMTPSATQLQVSGGPRGELIPAGTKIPSYTAPSLDGGGIDWAGYAGKPTVLTIWASWCPHCQVELPVLDSVSKDYPDVQVTSISTAQGQEPGPTPQEYVAQNNISFPVAVDDPNMTLLRAMGVQSFPTIYFVDADGAVVGSYEGELPEIDLRSRFTELQQAG